MTNGRWHFIDDKYWVDIINEWPVDPKNRNRAVQFLYREKPNTFYALRTSMIRSAITLLGSFRHRALSNYLGFFDIVFSNALGLKRFIAWKYDFEFQKNKSRVRNQLINELNLLIYCVISSEKKSPYQIHTTVCVMLRDVYQIFYINVTYNNYINLLQMHFSCFSNFFIPKCKEILENTN